MNKGVLVALSIGAALPSSSLRAQNTVGGNGGRGGGVYCNHCTIYGGSMSGGGGGNGGGASASSGRGSRNHGAPSAGGGLLSSFRIEIRLVGGQEILSRNWRRTQDRWVEIYPEGKKEYFDILGVDTVNGCVGTVAGAGGNNIHKVFIANRGCEGMPFYVRDGNNEWGSPRRCMM